MNEKELAEIRARADAATVGPWDHESMTNDKDLIYDSDGCGLAQTCIPGLGGARKISFEERRANADFCCHARTDIPLLLDEVERLRDELRMISEDALAGVNNSDTVHKAHNWLRQIERRAVSAIEKEKTPPVGIGNQKIPPGSFLAKQNEAFEETMIDSYFKRGEGKE